MSYDTTAPTHRGSSVQQLRRPDDSHRRGMGFDHGTNASGSPGCARPPDEARPDETLHDEYDAASTVYQPIVHLDSGLTIGAEALTRFAGESPAPRFDRARRTGELVALELEAASRVVAEQDRWPTSWASVSINVSEWTLTDPRLAECLRAIGNKVMVDVVNGPEAGDRSSLRRALSRLRAHGTRIALDGWNHTNDNVARLERLRPDAVKLSVGTTATLGGSWQVAEHERLAARCRRAGILLMAVGVEAAWQRKVLTDLGVEAAQGYHLGRPAPLDSHAELVEPLGWIETLGVSGTWHFDNGRRARDLVGAHPAHSA